MTLLLKVPLWIWLAWSALFFAGGEYLSKVWVLNPSWKTVALLVGMYVLGVLCWLPALMHKNELAVLGTIWLLLGLMATVAIGLLVFHETVSLVQWSGIILGMVAIVLLAQ